MRGGEGVRRAIKSAKVKPVEHLPRDRFLTLLKGCKAIVGNSSAGLIEAAALKTACVNVGPRQNGREKPGNVIDCGASQVAIEHALQKALSFDLRRMVHPYGDGRAGEKISGILGETGLADIPLRKRNAY